MVVLSWPVALYTFRLNKKVSQMMLLVPYLAPLLFLFFIPLGMYSPCIREEGTLGPKPALIGHRGAPMLAPENTFMSFAKTIQYEGDGFETDVTISFDGVPFLMHDKTLTRTTNIREVKPEDANEMAAMFTWDTLRTLNSGKWFFKNKPFYNTPMMSFLEREWAKNQTIYQFSDFLKLAAKDNKLILFDLYRPPEEHPYVDSWIDRILEVILSESTINPRLTPWDYKIMWILTDLFSGIVISLVFLFHWWREKAISCLSGNSTDNLASGRYSTFGTGLNAIPGLPSVA